MHATQTPRLSAELVLRFEAVAGRSKQVDLKRLNIFYTHIEATSAAE